MNAPNTGLSDSGWPPADSGWRDLPKLVIVGRRYAPYSPLTPGRARRRRRTLRTAELNMVGKAVVGGSCLAAACLGFAAGRFLGFPAPVTAALGGLLPLALLVAVDRSRWKSMLVSHGWGGTAAEVSAVAADLVRRGVAANVEMQGEGETASLCPRC